MGERQRGDRAASGRRGARPGDAVSGPGRDGAGLEALLAAAIREGGVDTAGEQRAVAAFRAARDAGEHRARTRRRDDWRPREQRGVKRSLKATLSLFLASLTLGGVAVAAIGTVGTSSDGADGSHQRPHASAGPTDATDAPAAEPSATESVRPHRPATARDTEAYCRAYEHVKGNGKALESTAWQRLIAAAGGERNVTAYCARQLTDGKKGNADKADRADKNGKGGARAGVGNLKGNKK
ncbi:hypothetical protein QQY66_30535 [Streptomyces sp. DG2A-72]|uniref:hypothetical protein n=1 Tax=Streptomyces sp. DG2A-72 TaxID=3051386 RepID=UPI00265C1C9A|nr:hypothetical protein [Streptomyces sp. DG2A-72]MDO0935811.1 hypothetical protein [Streptomyces sp. DG2A-72]